MVEIKLGTITPYGSGIKHAVVGDFYVDYYSDIFEGAAITITKDYEIQILGEKYDKLTQDLQNSICGLVGYDERF